MNHQQKAWWSKALKQLGFFLPILAVSCLIVAWAGQAVPIWIPQAATFFIEEMPFIAYLLNLSLVHLAILMLPFGLLSTLPLLSASVGPYPTSTSLEKAPKHHK